MLGFEDKTIASFSNNAKNIVIVANCWTQGLRQPELFSESFFAVFLGRWLSIIMLLRTDGGVVFYVVQIDLAGSLVLTVGINFEIVGSSAEGVLIRLPLQRLPRLGVHFGVCVHAVVVRLHSRIHFADFRSIEVFDI